MGQININTLGLLSLFFKHFFDLVTLNSKHIHIFIFLIIKSKYPTNCFKTSIAVMFHKKKSMRKYHKEHVQIKQHSRLQNIRHMQNTCEIILFESAQLFQVGNTGVYRVPLILAGSNMSHWNESTVWFIRRNKKLLYTTILLKIKP